MPEPLPAGVTAQYPLAGQQRGLWYVQQLDPGCGAYHLLFSVDAELPSGFDPAALGEHLHMMTRDYEMLRTSLPANEGLPQQCVHAEVEPDIRFDDVSAMDDDALRTLARANSREPFDIGVPPLWRLHVYARGQSRYLVVLVAHHVLLDFWSLGLLLQEFLARTGLSAGSKTEIDGNRFGLYAREQRLRRQVIEAGDIADPSLDYWKERLQGLPPSHGIALDHPRPAMQSYEGRSVAFALSAEASHRVRALARNEGVTPFMVLLAAYATLLRRYGREDDIAIASPVVGRSDRKQRAMLGQFVNTVVFRLSTETDQSFLSLLAQARRAVVDSMRHHDCEFSTLVEQLTPQRDPSMPPLAQIAFAWERLPLLAEFENFFLHDPIQHEHRIGEIVLRPFAIPQQEGQFDLALEMGGERDGAYLGVFKYQTALWDHSTVEQFADSFRCLVEDLTASPVRSLSQAALVDPQSGEAWLHLCDGSARPLEHSDILSTIAEHAAATPDAIAVRDQSRVWTYRELWFISGEIAKALRERHVHPNDRVGLMLPRDCRLLAGMLGIWRAQAAYVPLDPDFPTDRLRYIAEDSGLVALVSLSTLETEWPTSVSAICLDILDSEPDKAPSTDRLVDFAHEAAESTRAGEIAYVMYTSGSTGKPKGVCIGHRSVFNFLLGMHDLLGIDARARLLAVTTLAFDISVLELLLPLSVGAQVCIANSETIRDGKLLAQRMHEWGADWMQATPATWKMLIDSGWRGTSTLTALCGGEALSSQLAAALLERSSRLWNMYGPTETTVWSTAAAVESADTINIGTPILNTQAYVLDEHLQPVPPGVPGELWLGGEGLAVGYWNLPELTEQRFRTLDSLPQAGRLYRTGDLVRWHRGVLEHQGRLDFQVKLRGYRIELGEIESALRQQPGVGEAVVILREDRPGDKRLVAYLLAAVDAQPLLSELKPALRQRLPEYMVPSAVVLLDELPQTANRKIDRKALPKPDDSASSNDYVAPRDAIEIRLSGIFASLLGVERVGLHDSFFDLGGHSLLAVQLVAAMKREFATELAISELVQSPTVVELAMRVRGDSAAVQTGLQVVLKKADGAQPLWLFHPIGGNIFCYLEMARAMSPGRPMIAIQSPGLDADGEADVTVEAIAARYIVSLRERQPNGPYLLGGWCFGGVIAFETARQLREQGETVDGVVLIDTRAPIEKNVPNDADDATLLSWFARDLAMPFGKTLAIVPETLRELPSEAMFAYVLDSAKAIGVLPRDADAGQIARYFEVYMANGMALRMYFPEPDTVPVLLCLAGDETEDYGPLLGWDALLDASLQTVTVSGDHNSVMYSPQISEVAAIVDYTYPIRPFLGFAL